MNAGEIINSFLDTIKNNNVFNFENLNKASNDCKIKNLDLKKITKMLLISYKGIFS
jgi:hypothetical protein